MVDQSPGRLHSLIPESRYPTIVQPSGAEIRDALTFLIRQEPREKWWGGKHRPYDRAEWEDPTSRDYEEDDYAHDWAFYEWVSGNYVGRPPQRDHLVSLKEAHVSGGCDWPQRKKWHFYSDRGNIFLATRSLNESKSYHDPVLWRPPRVQAWPRYAETWIRVKRKWDLGFDAAEIAFLRWMLITPVE